MSLLVKKIKSGIYGKVTSKKEVVSCTLCAWPPHWYKSKKCTTQSTFFPGRLSWQYLRVPTLGRCSLSQWSSSSVYSTRDPSRGLLAATGTCKLTADVTDGLKRLVEKQFQRISLLHRYTHTHTARRYSVTMDGSRAVTTPVKNQSAYSPTHRRWDYLEASDDNVCVKSR